MISGGKQYVADHVAFNAIKQAAKDAGVGFDQRSVNEVLEKAKDFNGGKPIVGKPGFMMAAKK